MKHLFILLLSVIPSFAQVELSPRRLWNVSPDDVTKTLMARVESHLANNEQAKAEEVMAIVAMLNSKVVITDEYTPDNTKFFRFTPQYCINQLKAMADVFDLLRLMFGALMGPAHSRELSLTSETYRRAAGILEGNLVPSKPTL